MSCDCECVYKLSNLCFVYIFVVNVLVIMELPHIGQHCSDTFCKRLGKTARPKFTGLVLIDEATARLTTKNRFLSFIRLLLSDVDR